MLPFHPSIAHLPIVTSFLLPVLVLAFAYMIKVNKMAPSAWLIVVGLLAFTTGTGYMALESGEVEEHTVEKVLDKKLIHEHEEAAEIYVGSTVLALVFGIVAFFIRKEFQFKLHILIFAISCVSLFLAQRAGKLGGALVYEHGAGRAYEKAVAPQEGLLPTPGQNTSESEFPVDEEENEYSSDEGPQD